MITTSNVSLCKQIPINYDNTYLDIMFTVYEVYDAMKTLRISVSLPYGHTRVFPFISELIASRDLLITYKG